MIIRAAIVRLHNWEAYAPRSCAGLAFYTVAGIGVRLRPCANALRCKACQIQPRQFQTGFSLFDKA